MIISRLILKNWRNFNSVDIPLGNRVFILGQNASGKSNFLDVFRFLRDMAKPGGGLQKAIQDRGGFDKIRALTAHSPLVEIEVHLASSSLDTTLWKYAIGIQPEKPDDSQSYLAYERVWQGNKLLIHRPNEDDQRDELRLTQSHLEQINANAEFREISNLFQGVQYLHIIPQVLRYPETFFASGISESPFGQLFLDKIGKTPEKIRRFRLKKIAECLKIAIPYFQDLVFLKDAIGRPHLQALYEPSTDFCQLENQFSDGTLRLIGLLWLLLESDSVLLLEEPELSLNSSIIRQLSSLLFKWQIKQNNQVIITTHSWDLLSDGGIGGEEVILLIPSTTGTECQLASDITEVRDLLEGGLSIADAILPRTNPPENYRLSLLK